MQQLEITSMDDFHQALDAHALLLVDFYKDNCVSCKMLEMALIQLKSHPHAGALTIAKVKLETVGEEFFFKQRLRQTPTLLLFHQGEEMIRAPGFNTKETMLTWLEQYLPEKELAH